MKILTLGAGLQGSACAYDLLTQGDVTRVTVADLKPDRLAGFVPDDPRLEVVGLDFQDGSAVGALMASHDVVLSAAPYYMNLDLARLAIEAGCHYSDLGGNTALLREQLELSDLAREAGVCLLPDNGLAPGMVNVLAVEGIRRLDEARAVRMYVGGLPQNPIPPLNYQVAYSLEGMLDYYTTRCWILRDGAPTRMDALAEVEQLAFPGPGTLEAFHTAGGTSLLPWDFEGKVDRLEYKTLRYPGHAIIMEAVRDLGLISEDAVELNGAAVVPRQLFIAAVTPHLTPPDEPNLVALRVVAEGDRDGRETQLVWNMLDYSDEQTGISSMERTTGFTLAITGLFLGRGTIERRGAFAAYQALPYEPYVEALGERGVEITFSESP